MGQQPQPGLSDPVTGIVTLVIVVILFLVIRHFQKKT